MALIDYISPRRLFGGQTKGILINETESRLKASRAAEAMDEDSGSGNSLISALQPGNGDLAQADEPYDVYLNKFARSLWVYVAVNTLAISLSQVLFKVIDSRNKGQPNEAAPADALGLNSLLERPNQWMSDVEFKEQLTLHLMLTGNVYIEKAEIDGRGRPHELFLLNPKNMSVIPDRKNFVAGYMYTVNGKSIRYKPDEIIHIKLPDPRGESRYGLSPLAAARIIIDQDSRANSWNTNYFKNATWPSGIIVCKDGLNEEEFRRAKKELKTNYEGTDKAGKILILSGGLDWKQTTPNPKDIDFLNLRRLTREEVLNLFRVPPSIAGIFQFENTTSRSAGVREQHVQFWSQTIQPLAERVITRLNYELVPKFSKFYEIVPDVSHIPALKETDEMKQVRAVTASILVQKAGWTPNMALNELYPEKDAILKWGDKPSPFYNSFSGSFANIEGDGPGAPDDPSQQGKESLADNAAAAASDAGDQKDTKPKEDDPEVPDPEVPDPEEAV